MTRTTREPETATEAGIKALIDFRSEAIREKDIDRLMSLYAPDIVYFDLVPPLRYAGWDVLRARFSHWFDGWEGAIGQHVHDITVLASDDAAAAHMLIRASGTRKGGQHVEYWLRASNAFRRAHGTWLITHEHVSLPVDLEGGRVVMDLEP